MCSAFWEIQSSTRAQHVFVCNLRASNFLLCAEKGPDWGNPLVTSTAEQYTSGLRKVPQPTNRPELPSRTLRSTNSILSLLLSVSQPSSRSQCLPRQRPHPPPQRYPASTTRRSPQSWPPLTPFANNLIERLPSCKKSATAVKPDEQGRSSADANLRISPRSLLNTRLSTPL